METVAYTSGIGAVAIAYIVSRWLTKSWNPLAVANGEDGRPSSSKTQLLIWVAVIGFSYVAIFAARLQKDQYSAVDEVPKNILLVLGLSGGTMAAARAIRVNNDPDANDPTKAPTQGGILADSKGEPDIAKFQMIVFTLIAAVVYLLVVVDSISDAARDKTYPKGLPEIDDSLMVIMGISQGTYVGKKLTVKGPQT